MSNEKNWSIDIDNNKHKIKFIQSKFSGKNRLEIDENEVAINKSAFQGIVGIDQLITIGNKECRFVSSGNKADIVVDGVYVDSKKQYIPSESIQWWGWIFVVMCVAIPIISLGGALPALIGMVGGVYCIRISVSPYRKTGSKVLACSGITITAWLLFLLLIAI